MQNAHYGLQMRSQLDYLMHRAVNLFKERNLEAASLILRQLIKVSPNHSDALGLRSVIAAQLGDYPEALDFIERAIKANKKNGILYSNRGNILLKMNRVSEAIRSYKKAIEIAPGYSEAYGNLGNALQEIGDYVGAISEYERAILINPEVADFHCHNGNAKLAIGLLADAQAHYLKAIQINKNHSDSHYYLGLLSLKNFDFGSGWRENEWRWTSNGFDSPVLYSKKPRWGGESCDCTLLVWCEQGIGDQILYASMLNELKGLVKSIIVSVDRKLVPIFTRSFPHYRVVEKNNLILDCDFDVQIPIGSLGQIFRKSHDDFLGRVTPYLRVNKALIESNKKNNILSNKIICGLSWKSSNQVRGNSKSIKIDELAPIFNLTGSIDFLNLQYGETQSDIELAKNQLGIEIKNYPDADLTNDLDLVLSLIWECDIIVTTSNTIAHMAGAIGKESLLLLPFSAGAIWYWHDIEGVSLWYPSIRIFKQQKQGDWTAPIQAAIEYLENRFAI